MAESINVDQWLKENKLTEHCELFKSKEIAIEELAEFEDDDLNDFATETLKLDTLSKNRFIRSINKIKQAQQQQLPASANNANVKRRHVIISTQEHEALTKLHQKFEDCTKLKMTIQGALEIPSSVDTINEINNVFDEMKQQLLDRKEFVLSDIDKICSRKEQMLKEQMSALENEYIPMINDGKKQYDAMKDGNGQKMNVVQMVNNILTFGNKPISTTVAVTQQRLQFDGNQNVKNLEKMMKMFEINDCDNPSVVSVKIRKVESDEIFINYDIKKAHYALLERPILKILIEYALIKNEDEIWNDGNEDSVNESDSDSDTQSDDDSSSNSDSDDGNKTKKKKKKKKKKDKMKKPKAKISLIDIHSISNYDSLKWLSQEIKVSKKKKKSDKKYVICENIKMNKTYLLRMKALNPSGWSSYPAQLYAIKTPKTSSKILKSKELHKLFKMVHNKLDKKYKWKLIMRASKDGFTGHQFHSKCDNLKRTICIVQTDTNNVFGGYMGIPWQKKSGSYNPDPTAFVFLIRSSAGHKAEVFGIQHQQYAQLYNATCGPIFGAGDFYLQAAFNQNNNSYTNKHAYLLPSANHLNAGKRTFNVKELEVFQLK